MTAPAKFSQSLDDMAEYLNILYYGEPGSGKTSHAAAMAKLGKVYLVDVESGAKAKPLRQLGIPTKRIVPILVESYADLDEFYWFLKQELEDSPGEIAGVVFDSISEIHDQLIRAQVDKRHAKAVKKATNNKGELVMEVDDNEFLIDLPDRGIVTEQLRTLTRRFRDLPCHVAFVALAKREVDPSGEGVVYLPQLPPKFGAQIRGFVDVVGYCTTAADVDDASGFLGVFRDVGRFKGKDRLGGLPTVMACPSFDRVIEVVFGDMDLAEDEIQAAYRGRAPQPAPSDEQKPDNESTDTPADSDQEQAA